MKRQWLLMAGVLDLFILSVLDNIAYRYFLYWRFGWFDIMMHLTGGVAIGLVSAYAYFGWRKKKQDGEQAGSDWSDFLLFNLLFVITIGIGWEIFEVLADRLVRFNWLDSSFDVFFGIMGSLIAGTLALWIHDRHQKKLN